MDTKVWTQAVKFAHDFRKTKAMFFSWVNGVGKRVQWVEVG